MIAHDLIRAADNNINIVNAIAKAHNVLSRFNAPACSISGGADSDILLHLIHSLDVDKFTRYIWFNTGLEFAATKKHLDFLRNLYDVDIIELPPVKPVAVTVREYGYPFLSKLISHNIYNLQRGGFHFKAGTSFEQDIADFPKCRDAINWWHNTRSFKSWNINRWKLLKEFLIAYPPTFSISDLCCSFSKKKVAHNFLREQARDLNITGTRKAEGGVRQSSNSCFSENSKGVPLFRPIFFFSDADKRDYERFFRISHSDCYNVYGLKRTGCVGCPFNQHVFSELEQVKRWEGGIVTAAEHIFAPSYEYTKLFRQFRAFYGVSYPLFREASHD
ncbi:MAG: phosphoadenosine phosphosulfate reductase family protein [Synergistaceae bacterium]|nr:phosphoadenosine phosphosulfate reductase family protein [Synergistaceae bacterium]